MKHLILLYIFSFIFSACSIIDPKAEPEMDSSSQISSSTLIALTSSSENESFSSFLSHEESSISHSSSAQVSSSRHSTNSQHQSSSELNNPESSSEGTIVNRDPLEGCKKVLPSFYRLPTTFYDRTEIGPYGLGKKVPYFETMSGLLASTLVDGLPHDSPDSILTPALETQTWWDPVHADSQMVKSITMITQSPDTLVITQKNEFPFSVPRADTIALNDYILERTCNRVPSPLTDTASSLDSAKFIKDSLNCALKDSLSALSYEEITNHLIGRYENYTPMTAIYATDSTIEMFGNYPIIHNYVYTSQFNLDFLFNGDLGQQIIGKADDVLFIYINNELVFNQISQRGSPIADTINLDTFYKEQNITLGDTLHMKVFYADLLPTNASLNLEITMSCPLLE